MLDIRLVREQPDFVKSRLTLRNGGDETKIDELLRLDAERRKAETALQALNAERKKLSKEVGGKRSRGEDSTALEERVRAIGDEIASLGEQTTIADEKERDLLLQIPNLPHGDAPIGDNPSANRVVREWGKKPEIANGREISRIRQFYIYDLHMLIGQEPSNLFLAKTMHFHA